MTAAARLPRTLRNPYRVPRPAVISFSGGRTSAFMLRHIVDAYGGRLPDSVSVIFANTGLERPETLEFGGRVRPRVGGRYRLGRVSVGRAAPHPRRRLRHRIQEGRALRGADRSQGIRAIRDHSHL